MKIQNILATKGTRVITIRPEQSLREAIELLAKYNVGAVVVIEGRARVVGILSERDIIRRAAQRADLFALNVSAVMTRHVITGAPDDDLKSVMCRMTEGHFRHLPICEQGELIGIVSIGDAVKAQLEEYQGEIETLETQMMEA